MEQNGFSNFGGESSNKYSYIIISKSTHWLRQISRLKVFLFFAMATILFNGAEWFERFWVESYPRNSSVKLFKNLSMG